MLILTRISIKVSFVITALMLAAAALAVVVTPQLQVIAAAPSLEMTVPNSFGEWKVVSNSAVQVAVSQGVENSFEQPYDQTVMRTYANERGDIVMLALAWGKRQRQDVKVHRPEICYPAQGMNVQRLETGNPIAVAGRTEPVPTMQMLAGARGKVGSMEAVRYWIRIGQNYGGDGLAARWYILQDGLKGKIPDGILVRASQRIRSEQDAPKAQVIMEQFLLELTHAVPKETLGLLVR